MSDESIPRFPIPPRPLGTELPSRPLGADLAPPPFATMPATSTLPIATGPSLDPVPAPAPRAPNLPATPIEGQPTVKVKIDGREVVVRKGSNVLEAAKLLGTDICHFCYHPGLTIAASCRQCLVEVDLKGRPMGKLQPSCQLEATDEMVVETQSDRVLRARQDMLEFTLKNHPIDCPICDKAGECTLQRHYMAHDHQLTRIDVAKVHKPKVKDIGREIVLDAERCILCSRCIRFCDEIPKTSELTMAWRGDHEQIDIAEGQRLDNPYSMNVVDVCPVGALTAKDFRFQIRAWELRETKSTCPGCATGCAIGLHTKHEHAYRIIPDADPDVNGHWMCDEGRYTYKRLDASQRIGKARVEGVETSFADAIEAAAERLRDKKTAVVFSSVSTNEANLALEHLAALLGAQRFVLGYPWGDSDDILIDADKNPNTRGAHGAAGSVSKHEGELALELAGRAYEAVIFLDGEGELSDVATTELADVTSICLADRRSALSDACTIVLPAANWAEILGTYINRQGRLRVVRPAWRPEADRRHRAEIIRQLIVALGGDDIGPSRELTRRLAATHGHTELLEALGREDAPTPPTLLRFRNSRG